MKPTIILFLVLLVELVAQRAYELYLAKKNTRNQLLLGAIEFGREHYWLFIVLHTGFLISLCFEATIFGVHPPAGLWTLLGVFVLAQLMRVWIIRSLEGRWTTRIIVRQGQPLIHKGPFRWFAHPNYAVVAIEIFVFPWMFGLYRTAIAFSILNAWVLLGVRVPKERRALIWSQSG